MELPLPAYQALQSDLRLLHKILADEVSVTPMNALPAQPLLVAERPTGQKGSYRLATGADRDATDRQPGKATPADLGSTISLLTTDQFVREIQAATGAPPDPVALPDLLATQAAQQGDFPDQLVGERADGSGKRRAELAALTQEKTPVVAALPALHPAGFPARRRRPGAHLSPRRDPHPHADGRTCRCTAAMCQGCPLGSRCRHNPRDPQGPRKVFISDYRERLAAARIFNLTPAFKRLMKLRPHSERLICNLTAYQGGRRARRVGLAKADFPVKMHATAVNLRQWLRLKRAPPPGVTGSPAVAAV